MAKKVAAAKAPKEQKKKGYASSSRARDRKQRAIRIRRIAFTVLVLGIVAATVLLLLPGSGSQISIAENAIGSFLTPVQNAITSATRSVGRFFTNWRNYNALEKEYNQLSRDYEQLRLEYESMAEVELQNERLTQLLGAQDTYEALDPVYAKVIAWDAGEWFETFSINKGSINGISTGMAVVCGDGLIGKVYDVGLNYAKVISVIDARSSVAVLVQRTRDNGVMRGQVTSTSTDSNCYLYRLPNVNNIMPGDKIVTSGTDSQYVKGLTVGTIVSVSVDESVDGSYAVVAPAVDFRHIEEVLVLRQVVEKDDGTLQALPTETPKPSATIDPNAVPTPSPTPTLDPNIYYYPSRDPAGVSGNIIENLPEDDWAGN